MLPVAFNEYSYHHAKIEDGIEQVFYDITADPEHEFRTLFSWSYSETPAKPSTFDPQDFLTSLGL